MTKERLIKTISIILILISIVGCIAYSFGKINSRVSRGAELDQVTHVNIEGLDATKQKQLEDMCIKLGESTQTYYYISNVQVTDTKHKRIENIVVNNNVIHTKLGDTQVKDLYTDLVNVVNSINVELVQKENDKYFDTDKVKNIILDSIKITLVSVIVFTYINYKFIRTKVKKRKSQYSLVVKTVGGDR